MLRGVTCVGANLEANSRTGVSPLMYAASSGHLEVVEALLLKGSQTLFFIGASCHQHKRRSLVYYAALSTISCICRLLNSHSIRMNGRPCISLLLLSLIGTELGKCSEGCSIVSFVCL